MIEEKLITCVVCPMGCKITVTTDNGIFQSAKGNSCKRGIAYAKDEITLPKRMVTSLLMVKNSKIPLSLKTSSPIPKAEILNVLDEIRKAKPDLPIQIGDVILKNVSNTGVDVVATRNLD